MSKKLIFAVLLGILCGCSGIDHDSRKELSETFVAAIACEGRPNTKTTASRSENNRLLIGFKCSFILPGNKISPRFLSGGFVAIFSCRYYP